MKNKDNLFFVSVFVSLILASMNLGSVLTQIRIANQVQQPVKEHSSKPVTTNTSRETDDFLSSKQSSLPTQSIEVSSQSNETTSQTTETAIQKSSQSPDDNEDMVPENIDEAGERQETIDDYPPDYFRDKELNSP